MDTTSLYPPVRRKARVEIIPLIDVVFFLLATFVLFILSLEKLAGLKVPLPIAGQETDDGLTVFIQASEAGTFYWRQGRLAEPELFSTATLGPKLNAYKTQVKSPRVLVSGDNKATLGAAVIILDEVRKAGIDQVSVETSATSARF